MAVHIFEQCSSKYPGEEEGYGERRLCSRCSKRSTNDVEGVLASQEDERWRGLDNREHGQKSRVKKSYYMATNFTEQDFERGALTTEKRILKNGNHLTSKSYLINEKPHSLVNTCAFDSVVQVMLTVLRNPYMHQGFNDWNSKFVWKLFDSGN